MSLYEITIVDVGARYGRHPSFDGIDCRYVCFEPDQAAAAELSERGLEVYACALGSSPRIRIFRERRHGGLSGFYEVSPDIIWPKARAVDLEEIGRYPVQVSRLDDVFADQIDILKLDVEGDELEVLKGATRHLATISTIRVEVSFCQQYVGGCLFQEVNEFLKSFGFHVKEFDLKDKHLEIGLPTCDAIYQRKEAIMVSEAA